MDPKQPRSSLFIKVPLGPVWKKKFGISYVINFSEKYLWIL